MADHTDVVEYDPLIETHGHTEVDEANVVQFGLFEGADDQDTEPPVVEFETESGTAISRNTPLAVNVTDALLLRKVLIAVLFPSGAYEVAWDGDDFAETYSASTRSSISGGYRYVLRRGDGGWRGTPTVRVIAIDRGGNEAT